MKILSISLIAKSPYSMSASRDVGNLQKTLDFIPGTSLRGVFARLWLETTRLDNDFREMFTSEKVSFSNLYIKDSKPIPMSASSCKYCGGFLGDKDRHGVVDILLPLIREKENHMDIPDKCLHCQFTEVSVKCLSPMKKIKGYYAIHLSDNSLSRIQVDRRLIYRTAISPLTETALDNTLYSLEVVEKGQTFTGEIFFFEDRLFNIFTAFIENHESLFVGADKSSGLGKFDILSVSETKRVAENEMMARIEEFNRKLAIKSSRAYFSVTLQSDAITTDRYMRYKSFVDKEDTGISGAEFVLGIAETRIVQGWNALTKLPREDTLAIEKGSVFVFSVNDIESAMDSLLKLEVSGIGRRRGEGFGRVTICAPFRP